MIYNEMSKNEEKWMANYEAVKAHVAETGHFPDKHIIGNNWVRYQRSPDPLKAPSTYVNEA